jgi:hypothetical protein
MRIYKMIALLAIVSGFGCKKPEPEPLTGTITFRINANWDGENLELGEVYEDVLGHRLFVENFKTYLSEFKMKRNGGADTLLNLVYLADFAGTNSFRVTVPPGDYSDLKFNLGVPEAYNKDTDPSVYANDHPLSVTGSEGMFWEWNVGYIFTKFDGKVDTTGVEGAPLLGPYAFHCGEDTLFRAHSFNTISFHLDECTNKTVYIDFDASRFLYSETDTIDLKTEYLTHTSGNLDLATRFVDMVNAAFTVE